MNQAAPQAALGWMPHHFFTRCRRRCCCCYWYFSLCCTCNFAFLEDVPKQYLMCILSTFAESALIPVSPSQHEDLGPQSQDNEGTGFQTSGLSAEAKRKVGNHWQNSPLAAKSIQVAPCSLEGSPLQCPYHRSTQGVNLSAEAPMDRRPRDLSLTTVGSPSGRCHPLRLVKMSLKRWLLEG